MRLCLERNAQARDRSDNLAAHNYIFGATPPVTFNLSPSKSEPQRMSPVERCRSPLPLSRADLGELIAALDVSCRRSGLAQNPLTNGHQAGRKSSSADFDMPF